MNEEENKVACRQQIIIFFFWNYFFPMGWRPGRQVTVALIDVYLSVLPRRALIMHFPSTSLCLRVYRERMRRKSTLRGELSVHCNLSLYFYLYKILFIIRMLTIFTRN